MPSAVQAWLDARAADDDTLTQLLADITKRAAERATRDGTTVEVVTESGAPQVSFDPVLGQRIDALIGPLPQLPTQAGHDAGILAPHVPTAMLFVRNPTGVSHSPAEHAERDDCLAGVHALTTIVTALAVRP